MMIWYENQKLENSYLAFAFLPNHFSYDFFNLQEFSRVGGLTDREELETEMSKVPGRTQEILASCHALVFVDNKLVFFRLLVDIWIICIVDICGYLDNLYQWTFGHL